MSDPKTASPKPTAALSAGTKRAGVFMAAAGAVGMLLMASSSKKTTTNNPIETKETRNVSSRFSSGGAKTEYTPGFATPRNTAEDVSAPEVNEKEKNALARDQLKSKQYNFHDQRDTKGPGHPPTNPKASA